MRHALRNQKRPSSESSSSPPLISCSRSAPSSNTSLPRTADGKPDLSGIWQVHNRAAADLEDHVARFGLPAGKGVVQGGPIPYQEWAAKKKIENAKNRLTADPLAKCYLPGVPRIMYMEFPFQIFQTPDHIAMTFEWSQVHRTIYTNGAPAPEGIDFWMGDSRGRWEGDTLVVDVTDHNDRTWFDQAGNFHSEALHVVERYTMTDAEHDQLRGDDRGSQSLHAAVDDQHAAPSADGRGSHLRVSVPGGGRGSQRRVRAGPEDLVSGTVSAGAAISASGKIVQTAWKAPENEGRVQAARRTASPTCRATTCRRRRRQLRPRQTRAGLPHARRARRHRRSARGHASDAAVGEGRSREPQAAGARLRRPDRALLRRRRAAVDVRPLAAADPSAARLRRHPARAHVVAQRFRWTAVPTCRTTCVSGRAIRSASGKAIRWSSRPRISTARRG